MECDSHDHYGAQKSTPLECLQERTSKSDLKRLEACVLDRALAEVSLDSHQTVKSPKDSSYREHKPKTAASKCSADHGRSQVGSLKSSHELINEESGVKRV